MEKRDRITKLGFILSCAGAAVGLGNIWKFPTLAGVNGGGFFILFYLIFVVILGIPQILGENAIGRHAQVGPTSAYHNIAEKSGVKGGMLKFWTFVGFTGALANFLILGYYAVIAGWILQYVFKTISTPLDTMDMPMFGATVSNPVVPIIFAWVIIALTIMINLKGVSGGVEKAAKILMPVLFVMLLICAVCSMSLPGAFEGVKFMLTPNVDNVMAAGGFGKVALAAMGQCFFSLCLGTGQMITYASYMDKDANLIQDTYAIPAIDTFIALLAGFVTLPAVFAVTAQTGIDPASATGPGMLMYALPQSLNVAFGPSLGKVLTLVMFLLVVFAAMTSTIGMLTVTVSYITEVKKVEYKKATVWTGIAAAAFAAIHSLSNGAVLGSIQIGGMCIMDAADYFVSNVIMPFGTFFLCIFIGVVWKHANAAAEITNNGKLKWAWEKIFKWLMLIVDPIIILIVFLSGIGII